MDEVRTTDTQNGVGRCGWTAIHDFMPPGTAALRVQGDCTMPTPGYTLTLRRAVPRGINPDILLPDLETSAPSGGSAQVLTPAHVTYEEVTDHRYRQVTIEPEGVTIDVQEVH